VPKDFREAEGEGRCLPVNEAAQALGVSVEALRGRIKRNTVLSDLVGDKRVVWVSEPRPDTDQLTDRLRSDSAALISAKDETIAALRDQLEAERQAHAEARRLLMAAIERIPPQLEAPQEARESSESPGPTDTSRGAQEGTQRRSWWRRMFGG
jgi:hypothetical protein